MGQPPAAAGRGGEAAGAIPAQRLFRASYANDRWLEKKTPLPKAVLKDLLRTKTLGA